MLAIASRVARILALRWLRGWGYRGSHPVLIAYLIVASSLGVTALAADALHGWASHLRDADLATRRAFVTLVVMLAYFLAGPALLLTESLAGAGSRLRATLTSLPLTLREIAAVIALPVYALAAVAALALSGLATAALTGVGVALPQAAAAASLACMCGYALAALLVAGVRTAFGGLRASRLDYPLGVVLWLALFVLQDLALRSLLADGVLPWSGHVLLAPWIAQGATQSSLGIAEWLVMAGVLVLSLAALLRTRDDHVPRSGVVPWTWRSTWRPRLVTLELTCLLRSPVMLANVAAAGVLALALLAAVAASPVELRVDLAKILLPGAAIIAALPLLLLRGGTRARPPTALLLGYSPARWVGAQLVAGLAVAALVAVPVFIALALYVPGSIAPGPAALYLAASVGVALAVSWLAPASPDNPVGQAVTSCLAFIGLSVLLLTMHRLLSEGSAPWSAAMAASALAGGATAVALERRRWSARDRSVSWPAGVRASRRARRFTAGVSFALTGALLFVGLVYVTSKAQSSPVDMRFELRAGVVPLFQSFRDGERVGARVEWGVLLIAALPIVGLLLARVRQLRHATRELDRSAT